MTNLKAPPPTKPLQPSRSKTNEPSQNASQTQNSQRIAEIPFYTDYVYLLESLATVKSIVLACDVPQGDELVTGFFTGFVEIVRSATGSDV
jgi:sister-chromatid-cohesion protein PDS5